MSRRYYPSNIQSTSRTHLTIIGFVSGLKHVYAKNRSKVRKARVAFIYIVSSMNCVSGRFIFKEKPVFALLEKYYGEFFLDLTLPCLYFDRQIKPI